MFWSGSESFDFSHLHWPFLLLLLPFIWLSVREHWERFAHLIMISLLLWTASVYAHYMIHVHGSHIVYLTQLVALVYLGLFIAGLNLERSQRYSAWAESMRHYGAIAGLGALWLLSFPDLLTAKVVGQPHTVRPPASSEWLIACLVAFLVVVVLAQWHRRRTLQLGERKPWHRSGQGVLMMVLCCLVGNLFVSGQFGGYMAVAFNITFFAATLWLIYAGVNLDNRRLVNLGFLFFALGLLARYFDFFWKLLDRSAFFMIGGLLLIAVAMVLDRKRRQLVEEMQSGAGQSGSAHSGGAS